MDDTSLYAGDYVSATYPDGGIERAFDRITSLPAEQSDNTGRVGRLLDFAAAHLKAPARQGRPPRVLDVGSGLCVFLHRMKAAGWDGTALDRDPRLVAHARHVVGVRAVCGDILTAQLSRTEAEQLELVEGQIVHIRVDPTGAQPEPASA